ncbi:MAG: rhodanese-like domain-containing protein [Methanotrichaceae archaeon]|nr:rhodanese-like domain-containing protein [Methanotrichaceae archaeon]
MKWTILALFAALLLAPAAWAAEEDASPDYMMMADEFMKGLPDNDFYLMPMSDLINATENETEIANWVILDVRPETLYAEGHIPGSINIPDPMLVENMNTVSADKKIAVVCQIDTNSAFAVAMLRVFSDREAWVVQGGVPAWQDAGKELVK